MRDASVINALWQQGGPFIGDEGKPNTVVTVQRPWSAGDSNVRDGDEDHVIHPTLIAGSARSRGVPIRWFQKADNSQTEEEIPNVKSVTIDRSIDTPAASCTVQLYNQWMYDNGAVPATRLAEGNRHLSGYFTPTRGAYPDADVRWGQEANQWEDTLVPNAILRTYQGYGGHSKTLAQCLTDGNLILTGIWIIDEVTIDSQGMLEVTCRDTGKLLLEQQLYPPLVPSDKYPLTYYRWVYENRAVEAASKTVSTTATTAITQGDKRAVFRDSAVDHWYPTSSPGSQISSGGFVLHGHKATDCLDGNTGTYCLSVGNSAPDKPFATDWWEFDCGEYMNAVYVHPWAGNYVMYVSVMENGVWQGTQTVPYDPSSLYGSQSYVQNTGANIPYVASFGVPWETARDYVLPRVYNAQRVRVSFRNPAYSGIGPWYYRSGMREFRIRATASAGSISTTSTATIEPFFWAGASLRNPADLNAEGYITVSSLGQVDAFGDCRTYPQSGGNDPTSFQPFWAALTASGNGYWVMRGDGTVTTYGAASFYGSPNDDGVGKTGFSSPALPQHCWQAICPTPSGNGYWCVAVDGRIRAYGDAVEYGDLSITASESNYVSGAYPLVSGNGLFISTSNGTVHVRGAATHYGNWSETTLAADEKLASVVPNMAGDGYWLLVTSGRIQGLGACADYGEVQTPQTTNFRGLADQLLPIASDDGYLLLQLDGQVTAFGNATFYGSAVPGSTGQLRKDGNYKDYTDIIRDLALWSGFNLFDPNLAGNAAPVVYGNLESTGSYAEEQLPDEIFDKRPVIDAMNELKEAVGYLLFVDDEGGLRFHSPNFWSYGNFMQEDGSRVYTLLEIDEKVNLTSHQVSWNDDSLRSLIIISSEDPDDAGTSTVTTRIVPQTAKGLRGLLKPAMWVNGWFQSKDEQEIMAELIALHIWFAQRLAQVTCVANPCIQIDDQVRIYERQTSEVFVHYVRGVNTTHDLDTGVYTMNLTTHWLGTGDEWAITDSDEYVDDPDFFRISDKLVTWLRARDGRLGVDTPFALGTDGTDPSFKALDPLGPGGSPSDGAATS